MAKPILVEALADSLSIISGRLYQFTEYDDDFYARFGERPPRMREGVLEGIGGTPPCCVSYPTHLTRPIDLEPPTYLEWL